MGVHNRYIVLDHHRTPRTSSARWWRARLFRFLPLLPPLLIGPWEPVWALGSISGSKYVLALFFASFERRCTRFGRLRLTVLLAQAREASTDADLQNGWVME